MPILDPDKVTEAYRQLLIEAGEPVSERDGNKFQILVVTSNVREAFVVTVTVESNRTGQFVACPESRGNP